VSTQICARLFNLHLLTPNQLKYRRGGRAQIGKPLFRKPYSQGDHMLYPAGDHTHGTCRKSSFRGWTAENGNACVSRSGLSQMPDGTTRDIHATSEGFKAESWEGWT